MNANIALARLVFDTVKQVVEILAVRSYRRLMYCTDPGPGEHIRGFMTSSQSNPSELHWPHIKVCPQEQNLKMVKEFLCSVWNETN